MNKFKRIADFASSTLEKQKKQVALVHKNEGVGKIELWLNFFMCFIRYGASPSDWINYRMWEKHHRVRKQFITAVDNDKLNKMYNPKELWDTFTDKVKFNKAFSAFIRRKWLYTREHSIEEIRQFVEDLGIVVVKPVGLSSGRGIYLFEADECNIDEFLETMKNEDYLLEERAALVPKVQELNPPSCQTIRFYTIVLKDGTVKPLAAGIRVGGGKSIVDNFHAAGTAYPIDLETGIVYAKGIDAEGKRCLKVPSTGIVMPGFQIPFWKEVCDFCIRAARQEPRARWIGWDVAITPNGCEMIEGNVEPNHNFLQIFDQRGRKKEMYSYK